MRFFVMFFCVCRCVVRFVYLYVGEVYGEGRSVCMCARCGEGGV